MRSQKFKMLYNGLILFLAGAFIAVTYMYAAEPKQEQSCDEPCPHCVPRVPLIDLEE